MYQSTSGTKICADDIYC